MPQSDLILICEVKTPYQNDQYNHRYRDQQIPPDGIPELKFSSLEIFLIRIRRQDNMINSIGVILYLFKLHVSIDHHHA